MSYRYSSSTDQAVGRVAVDLTFWVCDHCFSRNYVVTRGKPKHTRYAPSIVGHPKTSDDWARLRDLRAAWVQAYGLAIGLGRGPENVAHYCSD